ncbi:MAG TPA: hypothetical protein VFI21_01520 [Nocardioides sp.]|jgi:hypothetical protein|nr:hypothetical protein [Nocardioides sp.]
MGAVLIPVILVLIVLVLAAVAIKRYSGAEVRRSDRLQNADRPTLRYEVPAGQDPAAVLAELQSSGYDASADSEPGPSSPIVIIGSTSGGPPDREELRSLLARSPVSVESSADGSINRPPVRFMDEV